MRERIQVNPNIHFGKPCVAGTRITVQGVLELVREGISFEKIIRDYYPDLQFEDIRACMQYAIEVMAAEDTSRCGHVKMKFLLDQDVYASTAHFLEDLGHDVVPAARLGLSRSSDSDLLRTAREQGQLWLPVTETLAGLSLSRVWERG